MMTLDVVNDQNEKVGSLDLDSTVFGGSVNTGLIWESVVHQNASERSGTAATKTRGKVRGSGKKPWRQKGTGRSRIGSIRNPSRVHGSKAFGPKPHKYEKKVNRKVKQLARRSVLSQKVSENNITIIAAGSITNKNLVYLHKKIGAREYHGRKIVGGLN